MSGHDHHGIGGDGEDCKLCRLLKVAAAMSPDDREAAFALIEAGIEQRLAAREAADAEYVEVPVTRRARVCPTPVGKLVALHRWTGDRVVDATGAPVELEVGMVLVLRPPFDGAPLRTGIARVAPWGIDTSGVPAVADGDLVYRVEPE